MQQHSDDEDFATQNKMILDHLKSGKTITPTEALKLYGAFRLAARIRELRLSGVSIVTERIRVKRNNGSHVTVARYRLG